MGQLQVRLAGEWQDVNVSTSIFAMWTLDWTDDTINTSRESGARAKTAAGTIRRLGGNNPVVTDKNIKRLFWSLTLPFDSSGINEPWFCTVLDRNGNTLYDSVINVSTGVGVQPTGEFPLPAGKDSFDQILNVASVRVRYQISESRGSTFTLAPESFRLIGVSEADIIPAGQPPDKPVLAPAPPTTTSSAIYADVAYTLPADNGSQILRTEFNYRRQTIKGELPGEDDQVFPWRKTFDNTSFVVEERQAPYEVWCRVEYTLVQGGEKFWGEESDTIVTISGELLPELVVGCPPEDDRLFTQPNNYLLTSSIVEEAIGYQFQIAEASNFDNIWVDKTVVPIAGDSLVNQLGRLPYPKGTQFVARVRAVYEGGVLGIFTEWGLGEVCFGIPCQSVRNPSLSCSAVALADGSAGTITFTARTRGAERYILTYVAGSGNPVELDNTTGDFIINNAPIGVVFTGTAKAEYTCPEGTEGAGEKRETGRSVAKSCAVDVPCNSPPATPVLSKSGTKVTWTEPSAGSDSRAKLTGFELTISGGGLPITTIPLASNVFSLTLEDHITPVAGKTYRITIVAMNSCTTNNRSQKATPVNIAIPEEEDVCPGKPKVGAVSRITEGDNDGYDRITWEGPDAEDINCDDGISGYQVIYQLQVSPGVTGSPQTYNTLSRSFTLRDAGVERPASDALRLTYSVAVRTRTECCPDDGELAGPFQMRVYPEPPPGETEPCDATAVEARPGLLTNLKCTKISGSTTRVRITFTPPLRKGKRCSEGEQFGAAYQASDLTYIIEFTRDNPDNPAEPIVTTETTSSDTPTYNLLANTRYMIRAIAANPNGRALRVDGTAGWTKSISCDTPNPCPKAVSNLVAAKVGTNGINVTWDDELNEGVTYNVARIGKTGGSSSSIPGVRGRTLRIRNLIPGAYTFTVVPIARTILTCDADDVIVTSNEIKILGKPTKPTSTEIKQNDDGDGFIFKWSPPASSGMQDLTKYEIAMVSKDAFGDTDPRIVSITSDINGKASNHVFTYDTAGYRVGRTTLVLTHGESMAISIRAVNASGDSGYTSPVTGTICRKPGTPTLGDASITIETIDDSTDVPLGLPRVTIPINHASTGTPFSDMEINSSTTQVGQTTQSNTFKTGDGLTNKIRAYVSPGSRFTVRARHINACGGEGDYSKTKIISAPGLPGRVRNAAVVTENRPGNRVNYNVTWDAPANPDSRAPITGYVCFAVTSRALSIQAIILALGVLIAATGVGALATGLFVTTSIAGGSVAGLTVAAATFSVEVAAIGGGTLILWTSAATLASVSALVGTGLVTGSLISSAAKEALDDLETVREDPNVLDNGILPSRRTTFSPPAFRKVDEVVIIPLNAIGPGPATRVKT